MKKLSKISLKDATILDDKQLKQVFGGSGTTSSGTFNCSCNGDPNIPFTSNWTETFKSAKDMEDALKAHCKTGGSCVNKES